MTTNHAKVPMDPMRKTALVAGVFYLVTFVSIPTLKLYHGVLTNHQFITHAGSNGGVLWAPSWRSSSRWPASAPQSRCSRSSSGRTRRPHWGS